MKNRNIAVISLFAIVLAILVFPMISAATVMVAPVASGNFTTTIALNITTDASNEADNVSCYYNAAGGEATTWLATMVNGSVNDTMFDNATINTASFTDAATYNISCTVYNNTARKAGVERTGITIDNTAPSCTLTGDHLTIPYKGTIALTWTSSDTAGLVSTSVVIDGPQTQSTITDTTANKIRTLLSQETKYWGDWTVNITATDRVAKTCVASYNFSSYLPDGVDWIEPGEPTAPKDRGKIVLGLLIVGVIIYFAFIKKK